MFDFQFEELGVAKMEVDYFLSQFLFKLQYSCT